MKRTLKLIGITALIAVIGLGMAACDNGSTDDGGKAGPKSITVTGFPGNTYYGKLAMLLVHDLKDPGKVIAAEYKASPASANSSIDFPLKNYDYAKDEFTQIVWKGNGEHYITLSIVGMQGTQAVAEKMFIYTGGIPVPLLVTYLINNPTHSIHFSMFAEITGDGDGGGDGIEDVKKPEPGKIPPSVIPDEIKDEFKGHMPIHEGTSPPDISGRYVMNPYTFVGGYNPENFTNWLDLYIAFTKSAQGKYTYSDKHEGNSSTTSADGAVIVVGSGNDFTAYFISEGYSEGIWKKQANLISGTKTSSGIQNCHHAFILLDKGSDPSNKLMPKNTFRVFRDNNGLASNNNWK